MPHVIDCDACVSCGACEQVCPVEAITEGDDCYVIDADTCTDCDTCTEECAVSAISEE